MMTQKTLLFVLALSFLSGVSLPLLASDDEEAAPCSVVRAPAHTDADVKVTLQRAAIEAQQAASRKQR